MKKVLALLVTLMVNVACSSPAPAPTPEAPAEDVALAVDEGPTAADILTPEPDLPPLPGAICTPGELKGCTENFKSEIVCAADGQSFVSQTCKRDDGWDSRCNEAVGCLQCVPGTQRCVDDSNTEFCNDQGEWEPGEPCAPAYTGQVCEEIAGVGNCIAECERIKKLKSNIGCSYWAVDLPNAFVPGGSNGYYDADSAPWAVVVANVSDSVPVEVTITDVDGPVYFDFQAELLDLSPIPPRTSRVLRLPDRRAKPTIHAALGYKIETSFPVTAYQFNPLDNEGVFSNDATLLLPEHALDRAYVGMTREQTFEALRGYITVVATGDDTDVTMTVTAPTRAGTGISGEIPALDPGESITRTLNEYDVLTLLTRETEADLSGTEVFATRRVAVFSGSEASNAPKGAGCCADHLEAQIFPKDVAGTTHMAVRSKRRGAEKDVWRILALEDNTKFTTVPPLEPFPVLDRGEWYEFQSDLDFELHSQKPILLGQFLASGGETGLSGDDPLRGDPAFTLVPGVHQNRDGYVFHVPEQYTANFMSMTIPSGATVSLDGAPLDLSAAESFGTGKFLALRVGVEPGNHVLTASEPIGVLVHGYDDDVSYAYPAGMSLDREFAEDDPPDVIGGDNP